MPLATLTAVKAKLGLPTGDTGQDAAISAVLAAAERWVLGRTRLMLEPCAGLVDTFQQVQAGRTLTLSHRPLAALTRVEGRWLPGDWTTLAAEIADAGAGRIVIYGADTPADWPPVGQSAPWFGWRATIWPQVRVTYDTAAFAPPEDLADATAALAAYWYSRQQFGPASQLTLSRVSTTVSEASVPAWVRAALAPYLVAASGWTA